MTMTKARSLPEPPSPDGFSELEAELLERLQRYADAAEEVEIQRERDDIWKGSSLKERRLQIEIRILHALIEGDPQVSSFRAVREQLAD